MNFSDNDTIQMSDAIHNPIIIQGSNVVNEASKNGQSSGYHLGLIAIRKQKRAAVVLLSKQYTHEMIIKVKHVPNMSEHCLSVK